MNEQEWLTSDDPAAMLTVVTTAWPPAHLPGTHTVGKCPAASPRKLRLFACAIQNAANVKRGEALEADDEELIVTHWHNHGLSTEFQLERKRQSLGPTGWLTLLKNKQATDLLREIVGNPYRRDYEWTDGVLYYVMPANAERVEWLTPTVLSLTQAAYNERPGCEETYHLAGVPCRRQVNDGTLDPQRFAVLSDALEEAGCDDQNILRHLRGWKPTGYGSLIRISSEPIQHVRGCWVLDLLLGKG